MAISNHLYSNIEFYQKICLIMLELANILFKRFTLFPDNRFHKKFTKWNAASFSLTLELMFLSAWEKHPRNGLCHLPGLYYFLLIPPSCYFRVLWVMATSFFKSLHWLPHCFCSAFRVNALPAVISPQSLLQILTALVNSTPLLTKMLLCSPTILSLTHFHLASEILS